MTPRLASGILAAIAALVADQAVKLWLLDIFDIAGRGAVRVTPFFDLVLAWNTGISYGWFSDGGDLGRWLLIGFKVVAVIALSVWMVRTDTKLVATALGLIIGGAIGNAIDRIVHGAVFDYALLHVMVGGHDYSWYVFNLADAAIVAGVVGLLYDSFRTLDAVKAP